MRDGRNVLSSDSIVNSSIRTYVYTKGLVNMDTSHSIFYTLHRTESSHYGIYVRKALILVQKSTIVKNSFMYGIEVRYARMRRYVYDPSFFTMTAHDNMSNLNH